jgi:hopene-associated glycosyltransferase HpnB
MILGIIFAVLPLLIWLYLLFGRDRFWLFAERDDSDADTTGETQDWPCVVAVVPARNEADVIGRSLGSLLAQDYRGSFHVVLVDDQSDDGTGEIAHGLDSERLTVLSGASRPPGWTGKLWAMSQGVEAAAQYAPDFLWFTDADIAHSPSNLSQLVARAGTDKVLVSLMARLSCQTPAEHFLVPAFVFFFAMLYPFGAVNRPDRAVAAAAGGCMLARRTALVAAGGIAAIHHNIIDDCALARLMKRQGPIWLGLTNRARSLRPYPHLSDIRQMVSRSAYAELDYSWLRLLGTLAGLVLVYIAPVAIVLFADGPIQWAGAAAWLLMALALQPILRFYRLSPFWGFLLPAIAGFYAAFTLDSAIQYWRGRGGMWKGRAQAGEGPGEKTSARA